MRRPASTLGAVRPVIHRPVKPARVPQGTGRLATSGRMDAPGYAKGGKVTAKKAKPKGKAKRK